MSEPDPSGGSNSPVRQATAELVFFGPNFSNRIVEGRINRGVSAGRTSARHDGAGCGLDAVRGRDASSQRIGEAATGRWCDA